MITGWGPLGSDPLAPFDRKLGPIRIADHHVRGPNLFISQFKNKAFMAAVLQAALFQVQRLEDAAWEVATYRRIALASGNTLDLLGAIVRRGRGDLGDSDYRIAIRAQIKILRSSGKPEDIIAIARLSVPKGTRLRYREEWPLGIRIEVETRVTFAIDVLFTALRIAKAGAVRVGLVYSENVVPGRWFRFAPGDEPVEDLNRGLGNALDPTTGGRLRTIKVSSP